MKMMLALGLFALVVGTWGTLKLVGGSPSAPASGAGVAARVAETPNVTVGLAPTDEATPASGASSAVPASPTLPPDGYRRPTPSGTPLTSDPALLEAAVMAYTRALQAKDVAALHDMLSVQCAGADPAKLLAARRADIADDIGVSIDRATVIAPQIIHFDQYAGVAHLFLGLERNGRRLYTLSTDGWLFEDGHWKSAECPPGT